MWKNTAEDLKKLQDHTNNWDELRTHDEKATELEVQPQLSASKM